MSHIRIEQQRMRLGGESLKSRDTAHMVTAIKSGGPARIFRIPQVVWSEKKIILFFKFEREPTKIFTQILINRQNRQRNEPAPHTRPCLGGRLSNRTILPKVALT